MSVAAPARARQGSAPAGLVNPFPMRYPDSSSPRVMARRGWWLVVLNFVIPGSAQAVAGNRRLARFGLAATLTMWALIVIAVVVTMLWRVVALTIATNGFFLLVVQIVLVAYAILWVVLTIDTIRLVRLVKLAPLARIVVAALAAISLIVAGGSAAYAAGKVQVVRDGIGAIFGGGAAVPPSDGYYNIMLLGADSGEGRDSVRFDSISVVSINADSGAVTIWGLPRDLGGFPFVDGPMKDLYPTVHKGHVSPTCGWGPGLNQLRTEVEVCRKDQNLYADAASQGSTPGVEATRDAAQAILGIQIPYYTFIDMNGFASLIDALGGIDINVTERLPEGWGPRYEGEPAAKWAVGWIEPGQQHMDGDTAQWYARSRYTTSDWDRMARQRQLQEAILAQFTPVNVLGRFQDIVNAGTHLVETDIPESMLGYFVDLGAKAKSQPVTSINLTPDNGVDQDKPNIDKIHELVQTTLHPPSPSPAG